MDTFRKNKPGIPEVIAGPCSAESREQVLATARALREIGVTTFRAGAWKPRTRPGCFEGYGAEALEWIAEAKRLYGMRTLTETATPEHLAAAVKSGVDGVWIGARTCTNPFAMQALADALAILSRQERERLEVYVKNPVNPDIELWTGAIERLRLAGVKKLRAVHRGFGDYGKHIYRNPPVWRIPIERHRRMPDLPLYCDPSHIAGRADLVAPLCRHALDLNFDGLFIESHCNPEQALSDSAQQVTPAELAAILDTIGTTVAVAGSSVEERLTKLRGKIDRIDDELIEVLARRMETSDEIGSLKREAGMTVLQPGRYSRLVENRVAEASRLGLSESFMRGILEAIHEESVRRQLSVNFDF